MYRLMSILTVVVLLDLNCYVNTIEPPKPKVLVTHISAGPVIVKKKLSLVHTKIYPPRQIYYDVNEYPIRLDAYETTELPLRNSEFSVLCFFTDQTIHKITFQAKDLMRSPNRGLSVSFPLEIEKSGYVGFSIATDEELVQQNQRYYYEYLSHDQKIYLKSIAQ